MIPIKQSAAIPLVALSILGISSGVVLANSSVVKGMVSAVPLQAEEVIASPEPSFLPSPSPTVIPSPTVNPTPVASPSPKPSPTIDPEEKKELCEQGLEQIKKETAVYTANRKANIEEQRSKIIEEAKDFSCAGLTPTDCRSKIDAINSRFRNIDVEGMNEADFFKIMKDRHSEIKKAYCD